MSFMRSCRVLCLIVAIVPFICFTQLAAQPEQSSNKWELVWADEFDYDGLPDPKKWSYDVGGHGWGNKELQFYTNGRKENARVENGNLIIEARRDGFEGHEYTSARLVSKGKGDWTYGRFEIRAKLPAGRGTWPAIWMLPSHKDYGSWPNGGEIDIMEHVGFDPDVVHASIHTKSYYHSIGTQKTAKIKVPTALTGFNTYAVEWTPEEIRAYVNDQHYFTFKNERLTNPGAGVKEWPFDKPFHLLLNIAVGGTWGGEKGVDKKIWPQRMELDYVRVYQPKSGLANPRLSALTELDKLVIEELKEKNTPGAVITVVSGDQVVYQKAFGVANVETNAAMQPEMLFRLGSTTKMFTAAALLTLAEKDKIKLNEPIGNRIKGLDSKIASTTPHHLLSNSAGVRDFAASVTSNDDASLGNMVRSWKDDIFFAEQGEIYSYSSAGFWLSGFVIEELEGKPYADAMTELLFKPLGMERTTLRPLMAITYPFAHGHAVEAGKPAILRPLFNNVAMWPAGSMWSNAKDLSRWVIAFLNDGRLDGKQLLSPALIKQMGQHHIPVPGETDAYYAYGLTTFKYQGLEFVAHGGFSRGYGSMIQMVPERKFAVIVLTNKSGETMRKSLNKATELGLGLKDDEPQKPAVVTPATESEMNQYVGTYSHAPQTWEVSVRDAKLFMKFDGQEHAMTKSGERKFTFGAQNENEVVFVPGKSGKIEFLFTELYGAKKMK